MANTVGFIGGRVSGRCGFGDGTFAEASGNDDVAPIRSFAGRDPTDEFGRYRSFAGRVLIVPVENYVVARAIHGMIALAGC